MTTKNPRINITLEKTTASLLTNIAELEEKSVSTLAKELLMEALDRREDMALSVLARTRDNPKAKRVKHEDAWK